MINVPYGRRARVMLAAAAMMAAGAVSASAQPCNANMAECSPLMKQMAGELGRTASAFWTPKLNNYKVRIDEMLSSEDRDALNRLRIRWALMVEEHMQTWKTKANVSSSGVSQSRGGSVEMQAKPKMKDAMEIFSATKEIASRYRGNLNSLNAVVIDDVATFMGTVSEQADRFAELNRAAVASDNEAREVLDGRKNWAELASYFRSEKGRSDISMVYSFAVEPLVLLYNGADLLTLFNQASPFSKPITGIELPEAGVLKQNFPNPASTTTRIVYTTTAQSSSTVLRLYNSRGDLVGTYDQGAQAAGEHAADINVSALATGSYLYHLTLQTADGPRVYSKTMQVVH